MKKTYQNPTTHVVKLQMVSMIASSGFSSTLGTTEKSGSAALSREDEDYLWDE